MRAVIAKLISVFSVLILLLTFSIFSTAGSSALDCAVFTGEAPSQEVVIVDPSVPAVQDSAQIETTIVDIAPVSRTINENEPLPRLNCFSTSNSSAIYSAPTCSILDQFGGVISQTPKPGTYTIVCDGGGFLPGFTANYGTGLLTVNAALVAPQPTSMPTPTPLASPSPSVSASATSVTPSPAAAPSPSALPSSSPSASAQPNPADLPIDTSVPLRVTGALQSCSTYSTTRDELALLAANTDLGSDSATVTAGGNQVVSAIEIGSSDYQIYENMTVPRFDCTSADDPSKVLTAPTCSAYDGESRITSTPKPGVYLIRCQGGEFLPGYEASYRVASFSVLSLPRVTNQPQQNKGPSPSPTSTPTTQPSPQNSPQPQQSGQTVEPTSRPTSLPRPTPTTTTSPNPQQTSTSNSRELSRSFLNSSGTAFNVKIVKVDGSPLSTSQLQNVSIRSTGFSDNFVTFKLESPSLDIQELNSKVSVILSPYDRSLRPAFSRDGSTWEPIKSSSDTSDLRETTYLIDNSGLLIISSRQLGFFGLRKGQSGLSIQAQTSPTTAISSGILSVEIAGGSGTGNLVLKSNTPLVCQASTLSIVKIIEPGECQLQAFKNGDAQYLGQASQVLKIIIPAPEKPKPSNSPSSKSVPQTVSPSSASNDLVIVIDSRLKISGKTVKLKNLGSTNVTRNTVISFAVSSVRPGILYEATLVLPGSRGMTLGTSQAKGANLQLPLLQFVAKGSYSLIIKELGSSSIRIYNLKVN